MDFGRTWASGPVGHSPGPDSDGTNGSIPAAVVHHLPPRNRLGQFRSGANDVDGDDALAA